MSNLIPQLPFVIITFEFHQLVKLREADRQAEQGAAKREKLLADRKKDKKVFTAGVGKYINPDLK